MTPSEEAIDLITRARIKLLFQQPFWGSVATSLTLKDVTDEGWCPTAATEGKHLFFNRDFIRKLSKEEVVFLVAHEVEHCVYSHLDRRGSRDKQIWNAATDFVINLELKENKIGKVIGSKSTGIEICIDEKFTGMCSEEVYEILIKDPKFQPKQFDVHIELGDDEPFNNMTQAELDEIRNNIKSMIVQAARSVGAGNLPKGAKRIIDTIVEPQMNWKEVLNAKIQSTFKNDFTWSRGNRKTQSMGIFLPSLNNDYKIDVAVAIDASGSMTGNMLRDLLSEVKGIMQQYSDFNLSLWTFDTKVYNYQTFTPYNIEEIDTYEISGGGGTSFSCNWQFMKENEILPHTFVMMTDGECYEWGDPDYVDTIFLIHSDRKRTISSPFGITLYYD